MNEFSNLLIKINTSLISKRGHCIIFPQNKDICFQLLRLLYQEGLILSYIYNIYDKSITIFHNYYKNKPLINILKIYDKSSFPIYVTYKDLLSMHKFGIDLLIISTSKGLKPHYKCIKERLGGRLICYIR